MLQVTETENTDVCQSEGSVQPHSKQTGSFMKTEQLKDLEIHTLFLVCNNLAIVSHFGVKAKHKPTWLIRNFQQINP